MSWAKSLTGGKVNNHPRSRRDKIEIRQHVLGAIADARVFDAFAGSGSMYREVWREALDYTGCDLVWYRDGRRAFVADNRRVLRAIDLDAFNLFDFDAYGSPWEQVLILCARRRVAAGERLGLVLTDGSATNLNLGGLPRALREIAGFTTDVAGGSRLIAEMTDQALAGIGRRLNARLVMRWGAHGKTGARVQYHGLVFEGL
jgi:hypothetical protein